MCQLLSKFGVAALEFMFTSPPELQIGKAANPHLLLEVVPEDNDQNFKLSVTVLHIIQKYRDPEVVEEIAAKS